VKRLLQRWFNLPPSKGAEFITDNRGEKFWLIWTTHFGGGPKLMLIYRGHWVGTVESVIEEDGGLALADVILFEHRYRLRGHGLGKAMLQHFVEYAREQGFSYLWGWLQPHEESTLEYLVEWYQRQGFQVYEVAPGKYHARLELRR